MKITNLYKNCMGNGVKLDISFAGCEHKCPGCYVPELWDPTYYPDWSEQYIHKEISKLEKFVDGFNLLGGDPLYPDNKKDAYELINYLRKYKKPITLFTGYNRDEIRADEEKEKVFQLCDIVITGRYYKNMRNKEGSIGSYNQEIWKPNLKK